MEESKVEQPKTSRSPPPGIGRTRLALRLPDSAGHIFILLFFFQFSFFLWTKLGTFLLFPFAFISSSLVTHIRSSLPENGSRQLVRLAFEYTTYLSFLPPVHFISGSMVS